MLMWYMIHILCVSSICLYVYCLCVFTLWLCVCVFLIVTVFGYLLCLSLSFSLLSHCIPPSLSLPLADYFWLLVSLFFLSICLCIAVLPLVSSLHVSWRTYTCVCVCTHLDCHHGSCCYCCLDWLLVFFPLSFLPLNVLIRTYTCTLMCIDMFANTCCMLSLVLSYYNPKFLLYL